MGGVPGEPLSEVRVAQSCPTFCDSMDYIVYSRPEYWSV